MTFPSPNPLDPELARLFNLAQREERMRRAVLRLHGRPVDDDPGDCDDGRDRVYRRWEQVHNHDDHDLLAGRADGEYDDTGGRA